jgi:7-carboxy-7-deazaguanine synthase
MDNEHARVTFKRVVEKWEQWNPHTWQKAYIKVVVFDDADYEYAKETHHAFDRYDFFISAGNEDPSLPTVGNPNPIKGGWPSELVLTRSEVLEKTRWLFEKTSHDPDMAHVRVMPQLHTLAWGNERGR